MLSRKSFSNYSRSYYSRICKNWRKLFLWLQNKFPPSNAVEQQAAIANKETTLEFINEALAHTENLKLSHSYIRQAAHHRANWEFENGEGTVSDDDNHDEDEEQIEYLAKMFGAVPVFENLRGFFATFVPPKENEWSMKTHYFTKWKNLMIAD